MLEQLIATSRPTRRDDHGKSMNFVAISWSRQQRVLHREDLEEMLQTNLAMLRGELPANDYLLLWVGPEDESSAKLAEFRPLMLAHRAIDSARDSSA